MQMERAHKRAMEDRTFTQKGKAGVQVYQSPQSVLELSSFDGHDADV